jgi:nucleotide-binding universal stress UspA family protein
VGVFERIVCGVDGSPESLEAVRQADVLLEPGGGLVLVAVVDPAQALHFQVAPTPVHAARHVLEEVEKLEAAATESLERARAEVTLPDDVELRQTGGAPAAGLLDAAAAAGATLVAVGTHGVGRAAGILLGSVATRVLRAPVSVLVARRPAPGSWLPRRIVVGVDASSEGDAAERAARELESRLGAEVTTLAFEGGRPGVHALVAATDAADLLVLGGRGSGRRHRLRTAAEHAAQDARCSVLVVRDGGPAAAG